MQKPCYILGIESSCDDTAAAIIENNIVLSNVIAKQEVHIEYGGVVPELASRAHQINIIPVVEMALKKAGIEKKQLNAIAYTRGPGLLGSLLIGSSFSKSLSMGLKIPLIEVNHMHGHILCHFIDYKQNKPKFPFLGITVSGGHTQIVMVEDYFTMNEIGGTLDDAIGEAFDKCGKAMGFDYPAGPIIDKYSKNGNPKKFKFPIPNVKDLDFSFSGFKTSVLNFINKNISLDHNFIKNNAMNKKALITGVTGQDGSYLVEFLLNKNYEVHGIKRRSSSLNTKRVDHLYQDAHENNPSFFMQVVLAITKV